MPKLKKHFSPFDKSLENRILMTNNPSGKGPVPSGSNDFQSPLPEVYTGPPNRIERYTQYDYMDLDSQVSASLDIIAEFCSQNDETNDLPFNIDFKEELSISQTKTITSMLSKWCSINNFKNRIFDIFRNTIKYGDSFFVRDPETYELLYIFPSNIEKVIIDESKGKDPDSYTVKDFDYNRIAQTVTRNPTINVGGTYPAIYSFDNKNQTQNHNSTRNHGQYGSSYHSRFENPLGALDIGAEHIVHLSMNTGLDPHFPFGTSILERVYKTFKQKELLEDSILIYRIQRAPERRIFYIDTGDLPTNRAMEFVERMKNEIHQKRIPTNTRVGHNDGSGKDTSGQSIMDAAYNPLSVLEDYYFPQCLSQDTKINLLDDRTITLREAIKEFESGKTNWVYSLNLETHEMEPGNISWAGVTRKNAELVRVWLDNGEYIDATPDHRFILRNGEEKLAGNLEPDDSLMPLHLVEIKVEKVEILDYCEDTCDITVDSNSDSHVFAVSVGVYVHNSSEGRGSRVETLAGGDTRWGLDELQYFDNKLARGLRTPVSYLPTGLEESSQPYTDGRVGTTLIQELRFAKFCERIQNAIVNKFDEEFKLFLKKRDIAISTSVFSITFNTPQNYAEWRKIELDNSRVSNFTQVVGQAPYISKRLAMEEYLGWDKDLINRNTDMYVEENPSIIKNSSLGKYIDSVRNDSNLRDVGINPSDYSSDDDIDFDVEGEEDTGSDIDDNLDMGDLDSE